MQGGTIVCKRLGVTLAKVLMAGGRLFQRMWGAVCWKEPSESIRIDMCGWSSDRLSEEQVESRGLMLKRLRR